MKVKPHAVQIINDRSLAEVGCKFSSAWAETDIAVSKALANEDPAVIEFWQKMLAAFENSSRQIQAIINTLYEETDEDTSDS